MVLWRLHVQRTLLGLVFVRIQSEHPCKFLSVSGETDTIRGRHTVTPPTRRRRAAGKGWSGLN